MSYAKRLLWDNWRHAGVLSGEFPLPFSLSSLNYTFRERIKRMSVLWNKYGLSQLLDVHLIPSVQGSRCFALT